MHVLLFFQILLQAFYLIYQLTIWSRLSCNLLIQSINFSNLDATFMTLIFYFWRIAKIFGAPKPVLGSTWLPLGIIYISIMTLNRDLTHMVLLNVGRDLGLNTQLMIIFILLLLCSQRWRFVVNSIFIKTPLSIIKIIISLQISIVQSLIGLWVLSLDLMLNFFM